MDFADVDFGRFVAHIMMTVFLHDKLTASFYLAAFFLRDLIAVYYLDTRSHSGSLSVT